MTRAAGLGLGFPGRNRGLRVRGRWATQNGAAGDTEHSPERAHETRSRARFSEAKQFSALLSLGGCIADIRDAVKRACKIVADQQRTVWQVGHIDRTTPVLLGFRV